MNGIRLGLSLSLVGPRSGLLDQTKWPFALRITIGMQYEPSLIDAQDVVTATLPWTLWPNSLPELHVAFIDADGSRAQQYAPAKVQLENTTFLDALKSSVEKRGKELARQGLLLFKYQPEPEEIMDTDETKEKAVPWPGLLQTLTSLVPPTPSSLKATWYFTVPRDQIAYKQSDGNWKLKTGIKVSAAPLLIPGAQNAQHSGQVQVVAVPGTNEVHRHTYSGVVDVEAYCEALRLESVLDHDLDEMDNYWLSIRDSRDDSLLDITHRLEQALQPVALLGAVSVEKFALHCIFHQNGGTTRGATATETNKALSEWREIMANTPVKEVAERCRALIQAALKTNGDPVDSIEEAYLQEVTSFFLRLPLTRASVSLAPGAQDELAPLVRVHLLPRLRPDTTRPALPGEGIELMIGNEKFRLRHKTQTDHKAIDDVAALQLFARRSSNVEGVNLEAEDGGVPWHPLTAGAYALMDSTPPVRSYDRILGITATYIDGVLYREVSYGGANLVCRNPMTRVHREDMSKIETSLMFGQLDRVVSTEFPLLALPLRYGDYYEFAASVFDRGGGIAPELCQSSEPWQVNLDKISKLCPPQRDRVQFLRRVPVGDCNILPDSGTSWPQTPQEIWLRCLEESGVDANKVPCILLVPEDESYRSSTQLGSYAFSVERPRIDEHTILRWEMPATYLSKDERTAKVDALKKQLKGIHARRDALMTTAPELQEHGVAFVSDANQDNLPYDPAVSAIGLRWRFDSGAKGDVIITPKKQTITVQVGPTAAADPTLCVFTVPPGAYVRFELFSLVSKVDLGRLDTEALQDLLELGDWNDIVSGESYRAFHPSIVMAETADKALPSLSADAVSLSSDLRGDVCVCYTFSTGSGTEPLFHNVHQCEIASERWAWRNLPIPPKDFSAFSDKERRRRLASGPPKEIASDTPDDPNSELVRYFDTLSAIDTGFVERPSVVKRFPRPPLSDDIPLYVDNRDEVTHADYLHYKLRLRSRYAGVLSVAFSDWTIQRRAAFPYRGDPTRIKPLKLLAVLPLTQDLPESLVTDAASEVTPFLVIFDEPWFREYGIGERIEARIATVKREIGDTSEPTQLRYGPLPDHSIRPATIIPERALECFGPFGFSLDRTGSQAKANATAFIVYPPAGTPPHYNLFIEIRRLLDLPSGKMVEGKLEPLTSDYSEAVPIYTLPDSAALMPPGNKLVVREKDDVFSFMSPPLTPFRNATGEVLQQYRYLLIVGRKVQDGGRSVDVFLPQDALWITPGSSGMSTGRWLSKTKKIWDQHYTAGVFVEILLNGRFPASNNGHLSSAENLRDLFKELFSCEDDNSKNKPIPCTVDASGMLRRVSAPFSIEIST